MDVCRTDTPPEKVPRRILKSKEGAGGSSMFASIMHKFVWVDGGGRPSDGYKKCEDDHNGCLPFDKVNEVMESKYPKKDNISLCSKMSECLDPVEIIDDIPGPETPGMIAFAPCVKRAIEEIPMFDVGKFSSSPNLSKRV